MHILSHSRSGGYTGWAPNPRGLQAKVEIDVSLTGTRLFESAVVQMDLDGGDEP